MLGAGSQDILHPVGPCPELVRCPLSGGPDTEPSRAIRHSVRAAASGRCGEYCEFHRREPLAHDFVLENQFLRQKQCCMGPHDSKKSSVDS